MGWQTGEDIFHNKSRPIIIRHLRRGRPLAAFSLNRSNDLLDIILHHSRGKM